MFQHHVEMAVIVVHIVQMHDVGMDGVNILQQFFRGTTREIRLFSRQARQERMDFIVKRMAHLKVPLIVAVGEHVCHVGVHARLPRTVLNASRNEPRTAETVCRVDLKKCHFVLFVPDAHGTVVDDEIILIYAQKQIRYRVHTQYRQNQAHCTHGFNHEYRHRQEYEDFYY